MHSSDTNGRLRALDGLRGLCACLVMIFHMEFLASGVAGWTFFRHSFLFVDFFFVLSGFVIARSYGARLAGGMPLRRFLIGRIATIYPLYILWLIAIPLIGAVAMLAGLRTQIGGASGIEDWWTWAMSALMIQGVALYSPLIWNVPGWSVAAEMMTYLLCGGLMRFSGRALPWLMAASWAAALAFLLIAAPTIEVFDKRGLARCLYGFATGFFAHLLHRRSSRLISGPGRFAASVVELIVTIAVVAFILFAAKTGWSLAAPLIFAAAILPYAHGGGLLSACWSWPPLARIGDWSYAIYICHFPIACRIAQPAATRLLSPGQLATPWIASLLAIAIAAGCIGMSAWLTRYVQPPLRRGVEAMATMLADRRRQFIALVRATP